MHKPKCLKWSKRRGKKKARCLRRAKSQRKATVKRTARPRSTVPSVAQAKKEVWCLWERNDDSGIPLVCQGRPPSEAELRRTPDTEIWQKGI